MDISDIFRDKVSDGRLRWFGHLQRRIIEHIGRRMIKMDLPGRRQIGNSWMW